MELKITNLSKKYGNGVQALNDVSLTIGTGMFGLLGPNGAGKSTLMRTIATLQQADRGSITLDGIDVLEEKHKVRQILGYLPQDFGVYPEVTAETMLNHIAILKGLTNKKERKERVNYLLQQTNLYEARKRKLGGYSGGMKQRFGIAQALLGNPRLIIVDEPTAGLDPEERNRFHNLLSELGEKTIVILSTHIVDDVRELCANMAIINSGNLLLCGKPLDTINEMKGKTWEKIITKQELPDFQERFNILMTRLFSGNILVHVYSQHNPGEGFEPIRPDLEDVYFAAVNNSTQAA
ncbi:MAG: ABC transporter ATP-binding protein [bacterium]|nr:ABC transporter ATP-binding protein [bacterium]